VEDETKSKRDQWIVALEKRLRQENRIFPTFPDALAPGLGYSRSGTIDCALSANPLYIPDRESYGVHPVDRSQNLPNGNITTAEDIGGIVRGHRKAQGVTQAELAAVCGVGIRFISELENGKPTVEMGKVLRVLGCLGLQVRIGPRGWKSVGRPE
jgi:y4mF family transcriptional regulator